MPVVDAKPHLTALVLTIAYLSEAGYILLYFVVLQALLPGSAGRSGTMAATCIALFAGTKLACQAVAGLLADHFGLKTCLAGGAALGIVSSLLFALFGRGPQITLAAAASIGGAASALLWLGIYGVTTSQLAPGTYGRFQRLLMLSLIAAAITGGVAGVILHSFAGYTAATLVVICLAIMVLIGVAWLCRWLGSDASAARLQTFDLVDALRPLRGNAGFALAIVGEASGLNALAAGYRAYGHDVLHLSLENELLLFAPAAVLGLFSLAFGERIAGRLPSAAAISICFAAAGAAALFLSTGAGRLPVALAASVLAMSFGVAAPMLGAMLMLITRDVAHAGTAIGGFLTAESIGSTAGPALAAAVLQFGNARLLPLTVALLFFVVAAVAPRRGASSWALGTVVGDG